MTAKKLQKEFVQFRVERSGSWVGFRCVCRLDLVMCFAGFAAIASIAWREILEFGFEGVVAATAADIVRTANGQLASHQRIQRYTVWPEETFPVTPTMKPKRADITARVLELLLGSE